MRESCVNHRTRHLYLLLASAEVARRAAEIGRQIREQLMRRLFSCNDCRDLRRGERRSVRWVHHDLMRLMAASAAHSFSSAPLTFAHPLESMHPP